MCDVVAESRDKTIEKPPGFPRLWRNPWLLGILTSSHNLADPDAMAAYTIISTCLQHKYYTWAHTDDPNSFLILHYVDI